MRFKYCNRVTNRNTIKSMQKILIRIFIVIAFPSLVNAQTYVSGIVSSDTTWSVEGSPYIVTGNVLVNSGVTLTIEAGVTVKFDAGKILQNKGVFIARGTSNNKITFTSNQSSPSAGDWGYLDFSNETIDASYDSNGNYSSGTILEYVDILYSGGTGGIGAINVTNSAIHLNNVNVQNNANYGIFFGKSVGGTVPVTKILNSTISNNDNVGIYCDCYQYDVSITVDNSIIKNNSGGGISTGGGCDGGSHTFTYTNNTIENNSGNGISANANGTQTITGNFINNNSSFGIRSYGNGTYTIQNNIITNNGSVGVHGIYTTHIINNNVIVGNEGAIEISSGGNYTITDNQIYNNNNGSDGSGFNPVGAWSSPISIQRNTFTSNISTNATVLSFNPGSGDPAFTFKNNNIFGNTATYELKNNRSSSLSDLDAENNWWGTVTESEIQALIYDWNEDGNVGIVDYSPFLIAPDTSAPISPPLIAIKQSANGGVWLTWAANTEGDLSGYKVYYDSYTGYSFSNSVDVGNVTSYTLSGVTITDTIAVTAYDTHANGVDDQVEGHESWFAYASLPTGDIFFIVVFIEVELEQSDTLDIPYSISNPANSPTNLLCQYSIDNGFTWATATIIDDTSGLTPDHYRDTLRWNSYDDLPGVDLVTIRFRITPHDQTGPGRAYTTPAFHLDNNRIPSIEISDIEGKRKEDISIAFQLSDLEGDTLGIICEYYDEDTQSWKLASISGDTSQITVYNNQITWNSNNDLPGVYGDHLFRIIPYDNDLGIADTVSIFIDQLGLPVASSISQFLEEQSGDIEISFSLADDEGDTINIIPEYSVNSGETWSPATVSGNYEKLSSEQYSGSFTWHSETDLPGIDIATVRFRITPDDGNIGIPIETTDFYLDNNLPPNILSLTCPDSIAVKGNIEFSLSDPENDTLSLHAEYSIDGGINWQGGIVGKGFESIIPQNYTSSYEWFTYESFGFNRLHDVWIRFTVYDNDPGTDTTIEHVSILNYPAEFTGDLLIDTDDLAIFAAAWNADPQDTLYEIGPATGEVPELIPKPDGVLDFEDLAVFIMMWNWSFEHNGFLAKPNYLAKASFNAQFVRLIQRYVNDPWNANGIITVDVIPESPDVMMVDGTFYMNQSSLKLLSVQNGEYLKQAYQAAPSFRQFNRDSSAFLYAVTGLGRTENTNIEPSPIITLRFKNSAEDNLHLSFEYKLRNDDGEIIESSGISTTLVSMVPSQYSLRQNYPNPFNPSTTIRYEIPTESFVTITVYDILGRQVKTLAQKEHVPGYHEVHWNGKDQNSKQVASGMYFCHLYSKDYSKIQKMVLLR